MLLSPARSRWRRWLRWVRVFGLGIVLGVGQIRLLSVEQPLAQWATTPWPFFALCAVFYVGIPALEGFLIARQSEEVFSAMAAGAGVGAISGLVIAIYGTAASIQALNTPRPVCPPDCPHLYFPPTYSVMAFIIPIIVVEGLGSLAGGFLGGWIGGTLGCRLAALAKQNSPIATQQTPSGDAPGSI